MKDLALTRIVLECIYIFYRHSQSLNPTLKKKLSTKQESIVTSMVDCNLSYSMPWRETSGALSQNEWNWKHRAGLPPGRAERVFARCDPFLALISDSPYLSLLWHHTLLPGVLCCKWLFLPWAGECFSSQCPK